ncbi:MAG: hypothetical protein U9P36_14620 [Thermodesulfobacteriota bacterium]|nr:hypothetical protein [Thermodesulfobacteriota bacterium]
MSLSFLKIIQIVIVSALSLFLLTGCVTTTNTSYSYSQDVDRMFQPPKPALLENHTYYFRGTETEPDSIIAIDNQFTMTSKVWARVDINRKMLDDWAFWLDTYLGWWDCPYRGVILLAPDGRQVGVGYSKFTFSVVKMSGPEAIIVYPPQALGSCRRREIRDEW